MNKGYKVEKVGDKLKHLLVDDCVAIGDNLETDLAGHSQHTREKVPVLIYKKGLQNINIVILEIMSDIGVAVADYFNVKYPENGKSFLKKVLIIYISYKNILN